MVSPLYLWIKFHCAFMKRLFHQRVACEKKRCQVKKILFFIMFWQWRRTMLFFSINLLIYLFPSYFTTHEGEEKDFSNSFVDLLYPWIRYSKYANNLIAPAVECSIYKAIKWTGVGKIFIVHVKHYSSR